MCPFCPVSFPLSEQANTLIPRSTYPVVRLVSAQPTLSTLVEEVDAPSAILQYCDSHDGIVCVLANQADKFKLWRMEGGRDFAPSQSQGQSQGGPDRALLQEPPMMRQDLEHSSVFEPCLLQLTEAMSIRMSFAACLVAFFSSSLLGLLLIFNLILIFHHG